MRTRSLILLGLAMTALGAPRWTLEAQTAFPDSVSFVSRNMSGPRMGVTYVVGGKLASELEDHKIGQLISQFGWHFEYQVIPEGGGPQFVIQFVPMVAGVEYGKLIPSATLAMGIRFPNGVEFGLGPNALVVGGADVQSIEDLGDVVRTALVIGVGKSFDYGGVSIPVNLVLATNPDGNRISVIFGYAIQRSVSGRR